MTHDLYFLAGLVTGVVLGVIFTFAVIACIWAAGERGDDLDEDDYMGRK